jgi:Calpain family cysteine protease
MTAVAQSPNGMACDAMGCKGQASEPEPGEDDEVLTEASALLENRGEPRGAKKKEPDTNYNVVKWGTIKGVPFVKGKGMGTAVSPQDVAQGQLGDCWFVSSLAALAQRNPHLIQDHLKTIGPGQYSVKLFLNGKWTWVNGNNRFPVAFKDRDHKEKKWVWRDNDGGPVYISPGQNSKEGVELWPMLFEAAMAKTHGGYNGIDGGYEADALTALTGQKSLEYDTSKISFKTFAAYVSSGYLATAGTWEPKEGDVVPPLFKDDTLVTGHAYWIDHVDTKAGTVTVRNPWGWDQKPVTVSWEVFKKYFEEVTVNPGRERKRK